MSLLTIVPFYQGDTARAAAMLDWMADLSGQQDRTIILAREQDVPVADVQRAASRAFRTVEHLTVLACAQGWPISANCYFGQIAFAMRGRDPWLLMESDCVATAADTLDRLDGDYQRCGKPNLGCIIPAYFKAPGGEWVEKGRMLAGVAIYHPNLWDHSPLLQSLGRVQADYAAQNRRNPDKQVRPKAFDCYLAPDILPHSAATPLIQHMGRSREFRWENDQIVCTYDPGTKWNPIVSKEAVLVHGQKDGSLIALLREEMQISPGSSRPTVEATIIPAPVEKPRQSRQVVWTEEKPADPAKRVPAPAAPPVTANAKPRGAVPNTSNNEAVATLADARQAIQHWPELCKSVLLSLQTARGRYRVVCQCGASSPKLPEGPDWEGVWRETAGNAVPTQPMPVPVVVLDDGMPANGDGPPTREFETSPWIDLVEKALADSAAAMNPAAGAGGDALKRLIDLRGYALPPAVELETDGRFGPVIRIIQVFPDSPQWKNAQFEIGTVKTSLAPEFKPGDVLLFSRVERDRPLKPLPPLQKLQNVEDILRMFPEWKNLTKAQRRRKLLQVKKKDRDATKKVLARKAREKTERLLTVEARARKIELLDMCTGHRGAWLALRRHADKLGLQNTKALNKQELIVAVLEKEFQNPYEELEEMTK